VTRIIPSGTIYELVSENLTGLGGPMGSERVTVNFRRLYDCKRDAMEDAENDYGQPITWETYRRQGEPCEGAHSGDLGHVMYRIRSKPVYGRKLPGIDP